MTGAKLVGLAEQAQHVVVPVAKAEPAPERVASPEPPPDPKPKHHIPILMYHEIGDGPNNLYMGVADFQAQMDYLEQNGYHTVRLQQVYDHFTQGKPLPSKPVALTFDDGYVSFYKVGFPAFKKHHFTAVLYAVPGFFGKANYVTWPMVLELDKAGMEIESHTMGHVDLPSQSNANLVREIRGSRELLEERLGHPVLFFCYPAGAYDKRVMSVVKQAGYLSATTTKSGPASPEQDPFEWKRLRMFRGETIDEFARKLKAASDA